MRTLWKDAKFSVLHGKWIIVSRNGTKYISTRKVGGCRNWTHEPILQKKSSKTRTERPWQSFTKQVWHLRSFSRSLESENWTQTQLLIFLSLTSFDLKGLLHWTFSSTSNKIYAAVDASFSKYDARVIFGVFYSKLPLLLKSQLMHYTPNTYIEY